MDSSWKTIIWQQFGAAIDMLDNALHACPDELWHGRLWSNPSERAAYSQFWYVIYHALFWLDLYLSGAVEGFAPPPPFTLDELDPAGLLPERPYTIAGLPRLMPELVNAACTMFMQTTWQTKRKEGESCRRGRYGGR